MVILLVFHAGDPGSIPMEGNIFSSSILFFPIFYIFCNKNLVAFYIKFNALAIFFFYKFSNPNRIITVMVTDMRLCHFFLRSHFAKFV